MHRAAGVTGVGECEFGFRVQLYGFSGACISVVDTCVCHVRATCVQIYRRSSRNRNEFLNQQRSSYGSMEDVLKKQEQQYGKIKY